MRKLIYLTAALVCAAGIGIAGVYLTACGRTAETGAAASGVSENILPEEAVSANDVAETETSEEESCTEVASLAETETDSEEPWIRSEEERVKVKGIYVTGAMAGTSGMDQLISLVDRTELNAMVIDVKNDDGRVVWEMDAPMVDAIGADKKLVSDMPGLVKKCKEHGIYLIARIVAFKDPYLAEQREDLALHDKDGNLFRDNSGLAWVNPYEEDVWEYLLEIAEEAVEVGFDEIQFDYIRFATDKGMKNVDFGPNAVGKDKETVITEFVSYAAERLHEAGVPVSADVYGIIIDSKLDASLVGQNYYEMSKHLDYISPMVYPSHYGPGNLGLAVPDAQPYETIYRSMSASRKVLSGMQEEEGTVSGNTVSAEDGNPFPESGVSGNAIGQNGPDEETVSGNRVPDEETVSGNHVPDAGSAEPDPKSMEPAEEIRADVRPWLQDFTATWVDGHIQYGPEEIRAQIQAVYDAGYEEWILWNAANRYTEGGLLTAQEELEEEAAASALEE